MMLSFFADFSDLMSPISLDNLTDNDVEDDDDINYINNSENKDQQQLKHYLQQHYIRCSRTMPICQIIQIRIKIEAKKEILPSGSLSSPITTCISTISFLTWTFIFFTSSSVFFTLTRRIFKPRQKSVLHDVCREYKIPL